MEMFPGYDVPRPRAVYREKTGYSTHRVPRHPAPFPGQDQKRRSVPRYAPWSQLGCQCSPLYAAAL